MPPSRLDRDIYRGYQPTQDELYTMFDQAQQRPDNDRQPGQRISVHSNLTPFTQVLSDYGFTSQDLDALKAPGFKCTKEKQAITQRVRELAEQAGVSCPDDQNANLGPKELALILASLEMARQGKADPYTKYVIAVETYTVTQAYSLSTLNFVTGGPIIKRGQTWDPSGRLITLNFRYSPLPDTSKRDLFGVIRHLFNRKPNFRGTTPSEEMTITLSRDQRTIVSIEVNEQQDASDRNYARAHIDNGQLLPSTSSQEDRLLDPTRPLNEAVSQLLAYIPRNQAAAEQMIRDPAQAEHFINLVMSSAGDWAILTRALMQQESAYQGHKRK